MFRLLQVVTIVLVAVGMALSLAHALELPGKRRLSRDVYVAVQTIYYPGFTVGGLFGEFGAMVATAALLLATPFPGVNFWLVAATLAALLVMHGVYWVVIHPVNKLWLADQRLQGAGAAFFGLGRATAAGRPGDTRWTALRDRWEYGHVARAALAMVALIAVVTAAVL